MWAVTHSLGSGDLHLLSTANDLAQTGKHPPAQWPGFMQFLAPPAQADIFQAAPF